MTDRPVRLVPFLVLLIVHPRRRIGFPSGVRFHGDLLHRHVHPDGRFRLLASLRLGTLNKPEAVA